MASQDERSSIAPPGGDEVDSYHQQVLTYMAQVARGVARTFGASCETLVYNLDSPQHSIVAIYGSLTGRQAGDPINDFTLRVLQSRLPDDDPMTIETSTAAGRRLKSTSSVLRDPSGHSFGAFIINLDLDIIDQALELLTALHSIPQTQEKLADLRPDDPSSLIREMFHEEVARRCLALATIKLEDRIAIVQALRQRGVFLLRNAPSIVGDLLGVSRFTVYNYLNRAEG